MSVNPQTIPVVDFSTLPTSSLTLNMYAEGRSCIVHVAGELDRASSGKLIVTSTAGSHPEMVIDLDALAFMDCSGYGALVESQRILEDSGRTLRIRGATGQPARLIELITARDRIEASRTSV